MVDIINSKTTFQINIHSSEIFNVLPNSGAIGVSPNISVRSKLNSILLTSKDKKEAMFDVAVNENGCY